MVKHSVFFSPFQQFVSCQKKFKNKNEIYYYRIYMRRLRGKSRDSNSATKLRTEVRELRSRLMTMIFESGNSDTIRALASSAALRFRAGSTSVTPRLASTRAVSAPIPDVAPDDEKFTSEAQCQ